MTINTKLQTGIKKLNLEADDAQIEKLIKYIKSIHKWNKIFNLTGIKNIETMVSIHCIDSLAVSPYLKGKRILDVGTGAGLPGIPLAVLNPDHEFTLLDSQGKKINFLRQMVYDLSLKNVEVVQARIEEYTSSRCFDTVISRAFGSLQEIISKTQQLCCDDGVILVMKGEYPTEELKTLNKACIETIELFVPQLNAKRHLVIFKKEKSRG